MIPIRPWRKPPKKVDLLKILSQPEGKDKRKTDDTGSKGRPRWAKTGTAKGRGNGSASKGKWSEYMAEQRIEDAILGFEKTIFGKKKKKVSTGQIKKRKKSDFPDGFDIPKKELTEKMIRESTIID